jgi:peptide/nickel transport system substrate-binding protein
LGQVQRETSPAFNPTGQALEFTARLPAERCVRTNYPTASDFIELKLSCRQFRPNSDFNNNIGFCDHAIDRKIDRAIALQIARPQEANALWAKIDHELVDRAVWLPTVTPKTSDFISKRVGNYQFHPLWGVLTDQLWVR